MLRTSLAERAVYLLMRSPRQRRAGSVRGSSIWQCTMLKRSDSCLLHVWLCPTVDPSTPLKTGRTIVLYVAKKSSVVRGMHRRGSRTIQLFNRWKQHNRHWWFPVPRPKHCHIYAASCISALWFWRDGLSYSLR